MCPDVCLVPEQHEISNQQLGEIGVGTDPGKPPLCCGGEGRSGEARCSLVFASNSPKGRGRAACLGQWVPVPPLERTRGESVRAEQSAGFPPGSSTDTSGQISVNCHSVNARQLPLCGAA